MPCDGNLFTAAGDYVADPNAELDRADPFVPYAVAYRKAAELLYDSARARDTDPTLILFPLAFL